MSTIEDIKAAAQNVVDVVNAFVPLAGAATVAEVDVKMSDGSVEVEKPEDAEEAGEVA